MTHGYPRFAVDAQWAGPIGLEPEALRRYRVSIAVKGSRSEDTSRYRSERRSIASCTCDTDHTLSTPFHFVKEACLG